MSKNKKYISSYMNYVENGIYQAEEDYLLDDEETLHDKFSEAKNYLIECLQSERDQINTRIKDIRSLRIENV